MSARVTIRRVDLRLDLQGADESVTERGVDEPLRLRALEVLGAHGEELARSALETGTVEVEHDVLEWEGSHGTVHAHRVFVTVARDVHALLTSSHAAMDALSAALSAATAERVGHAVADVRIEPGDGRRATLAPYRDPRG